VKQIRWAHPSKHSILKANRRLGLKKILSATLVIFFLSACGVSLTPPPKPTETVIPTVTATNTPIPTPTLTPTPTTIPIPEFMNEFIDLGYDKQSLESDKFYVVLDEKSISYAPNGLKYKKAFITSWTTAYYIENGVLQKGNIITSYSIETDYSTSLNPRWSWYISLGDNVSSEDFPITVAWSRGILSQLYDHIKGDYPIMQVELNWQDFKYHNRGNMDYFTNAIYPTFTGKLEIIDIPTIGKVIPATSVTFDFETQWQK
jgi:hypothetical protein